MDLTPSDAIVELRNLTFGYGERVILDNISLTVPRGKVTWARPGAVKPPF